MPARRTRAWADSSPDWPSCCRASGLAGARGESSRSPPRAAEAATDTIVGSSLFNTAHRVGWTFRQNLSATYAARRSNECDGGCLAASKTTRAEASDIVVEIVRVAWRLPTVGYLTVEARLDTLPASPFRTIAGGSPDSQVRTGGHGSPWQRRCRHPTEGRYLVHRLSAGDSRCARPVHRQDS